MSKQHYEDEVRSGREESPAVEFVFQDECARVLTELFEIKGLYQNVHINESVFEKLGKKMGQNCLRRLP